MQNIQTFCVRLKKKSHMAHPNVVNRRVYQQSRKISSRRRSLHTIHRTVPHRIAPWRKRLPLPSGADRNGAAPAAAVHPHRGGGGGPAAERGRPPAAGAVRHGRPPALTAPPGPAQLRPARPQCASVPPPLPDTSASSAPPSLPSEGLPCSVSAPMAVASAARCALTGT